MSSVPRYLLMATHVPRSGSSGGVVRYTVALAEALARRTDVELHVLAAGDGAEFFAGLLPPGRVHRLPAAPTAVQSVREWTGAARVLWSGRFDVVHGTKHIVPLLARGATRVLTVHDMLLLDRPHDFPLLKRLLLGRPYRSSIRRADVLVAVSRATRSRLLDHVPSAADRVAAVPLAASTALLEAPPEPAAALAGRTFALVVGDASARKNLRLAVRTWAAVREQVPGVVLAVVGPRPWGAEDTGGEEWDRMVADGSLVQLRGISDGMLRWCYENAAVLLCPSLVEGFGLPTVEAAALGTPAVTSDDPALCEASPGSSRPAAAWSTDDWVATVVAGLREAAPVDHPVRTWDDVATETVDAVLRGRRTPPEIEPGSWAGRIGVSPYRARLGVLHVVAPGDAAARDTADGLAVAHRAHGWTVTVVAGTPDPSAWSGVDVVVLHGPVAGRLRRTLRGSVTTVVLAAARPQGPSAWLTEAVLARWTHALVLPAKGTARRWARIPAPVTRLTTTEAEPDEMAAILARARAWGASAAP